MYGSRTIRTLDYSYPGPYAYTAYVKVQRSETSAIANVNRGT